MEKNNVIDLKRLREALPNRAVVTLKTFFSLEGQYDCIECLILNPSLYQKGTKDEEELLEIVFDWQREIISSDLISEFYTRRRGSYWSIYLKNKPITYINATIKDINLYVGKNEIYG